MHITHRLIVEIRRLDGTLVHTEALVPDWEPAEAWTRYAGARALGLTEHAPDEQLRMEPRWTPELGEPHLQGFRVHMVQARRRWWEDFDSNAYFADAVRAVVARCREAKGLDRDDTVAWTILAYDGTEPAGAGAEAFRTEERSRPWVFQDRRFPPATPPERGADTDTVAHTPVVVPASLITEVHALARGASDRETGGILVGHLCRDEATQDIWMDVTAQIPARHTAGDSVSLTFTSDTWTDVRNAVTLRGANEQLLGWWHSHPAQLWCAKCPEERQRACHLAAGFLSAEDRALHRTIFPDAYTVALVVTTSIAGVRTRLFVWNHGVLEPRGFQVRDVDTHSVLQPQTTN